MNKKENSNDTVASHESTTQSTQNLSKKGPIESFSDSQIGRYIKSNSLNLITNQDEDYGDASSIDAVFNCKQYINNTSKGAIVVFDVPEGISDKEKSPALIRQSSRINSFQYSTGTITKSSKIKYIPMENKKQQDTVVLENMDKIIQQYHGHHKFKVASLHSLLPLSPRGLQRKVKEYKGMTPANYLREYRLRRAKHLLINGHRVSKVAVEVGFKSQSYFSNCFRKKYGLTPKAFQAQFLER